MSSLETSGGEGRSECQFPYCLHCWKVMASRALTTLGLFILACCAVVAVLERTVIYTIPQQDGTSRVLIRFYWKPVPGVPDEMMPKVEVPRDNRSAAQKAADDRAWGMIKAFEEKAK